MWHRSSVNPKHFLTRFLAANILSSAGVKDSALTIHGSLQADRLGQFFAQNGLCFTKVFSSDLQRAYKTAEAIRLAQANKGGEEVAEKVQVTQLQILREQDFGFYEGKPFYVRSRDSSKSGKENHRSQHVDDPDFRDVEAKESMNARMDNFVKDQLLPLIQDERPGRERFIAVVSHGIILSHLWRCILKLFGKDTVTLAAGISVGSGGVKPLEYLGGWSNTGYLELDIINTLPVEIIPIDQSSTAASETESGTAESQESGIPALKMIVKAVNGKEHLKGLKRTRGVGSSKYDEGQKKIETFFKKVKVG